MRHRFPVPATLLAALVISSACPAARAEILITVDISRQQMIVAVDGEKRWRWPVSTGKDGYATPVGTFRPFHLSKKHRSREWDYAPMPHSIFFTHRGHAIHGSPETRRLGRTASHGCVRLAPDNAERLFELVQQRGKKSATVIIYADNTTTADSTPTGSRDDDAQVRRSRPAPEPDIEAMASLRRAYAAPYGALPDWRVETEPVRARSRYSNPPPFPDTLSPELSN
jgi:hypothetical protein